MTQLQIDFTAPRRKPPSTPEAELAAFLRAKGTQGFVGVEPFTSDEADYYAADMLAEAQDYFRRYRGDWQTLVSRAVPHRPFVSVVVRRWWVTGKGR